MDSLIGRILDNRYKIIELIGSGGMANVYKGTDVSDNRTVAVKVLREEFLDNDELVRRFKNESKAISMLSHPNIVKVYDVNFTDDVQYIVMEYIDGINFMQYLESQGKLNWEEALHFTVQVLRALQHAHDRGIVHRDIKPQNIMVLRDGSIKVMDFGIARFSRSQTRTITDKAIGSVHYISPEQARGEETDAKSDIYSLGVMLYEMLTGKLPFDSDSPVSVALKQISDEPQSPRELVPELPEAMEEITLKAMAKDPEERYQSASEMLADIEEFKNDPNIVFGYKSGSTDSDTKYFDSVEQKKSEPQSEAQKNAKKPKDKTEAKNQKKKRGWAIPALIGVTAACFIGALVLVFLVFTAGSNSIFSNHVDVVLPDFTGMTEDEIKANQDYAHSFRFEIVENFSSSIEAGKVITQDPMPPKTVKDNAKITLYVSKGIEYVTVPDIVGSTFDEAFEQLAKNNLAVKVETVAEGKNENEVIRISPAAGEVVEAYSVVTVYVQKPSGGGGSSIYVPDLKGQTLAKAKLALTANGIKIGEIKEEYSDEVAEGLIISQSITPNTIVSLNTAIDLVISKGKEPVSLSIKVHGFDKYAVTATVNGNAVTLTGGQGTAAVAIGETAVVEVTVTNTEKNESVKTSVSVKINENAQNIANVDVSTIIPASWSESGQGGGGNKG